MTRLNRCRLCYGGGLPVRLIIGCALIATAAAAKVLMSRDEALERAFPDADIQRRTIFLTESQMSSLEDRLDRRPDSALVYAYEARKDGRLMGTAYLDAHRVRTLPETLMVVVTTSNRVSRVDVLTFDEPGEYRPRRRWYDQFSDRRLDRELHLNHAIHGVTGATLTGRATVDAVRRILAIHEIIQAGAP